MKKLLFVMAMALMLALCVTSAAMADGDLVLVEIGEWWGADVTQLDGADYFQILMGDPICTIDGNGDLQPGIASEVVVSEDGLTITMTFPEGMYFFSGAQLEPEDVVASVERFQKVSPFSSQASSIASMDVDGRNVIFHLDHYSSDLFATLASQYLTVMEKSVIESKTNEELFWDCHPYGQYSLKEYVSGAYVVLERNPGYKTYNPYVENKGPAYPEQVIVRFINEEFTIAQEFNLGNIHYISNISNDGAAQITTPTAVKKMLPTNASVYYLELKLDDELMGDMAIRDAIGYAINREELCELYGDAIYPAYSFVTSKVRNFNQAWSDEYKANYCNDIEKANKLLDDAGYLDTDGDGIREKNGMPIMIHFVYGQIPSDTAVCQGLQIQLLDNLGIYLDLDGQDDNYHYDSLAEGNFQLGMSRFNSSDPVQLLQWVLCYFPSFDYMADFGVEGEDHYMAMCDEIAQTPDSDKRTEMVTVVDKIVCTSRLVIPVYSTNVNLIYQNNVTPGMYMGDGQVFFNDMKMN